MRGHKFSLIWMGYTIEHLRSLKVANIGDEAAGHNVFVGGRYLSLVRKICSFDSLPANHQRMLLRYVSDMDSVLQEVVRVLIRKGRAIFVVGDSTLKGVFIRNSKAIMDLGSLHGLKVLKMRSRPIPASRRYLPPPTSTAAGDFLKKRMRREVVITFQKG
jgi:hypothetical protein